MANVTSPASPASSAGVPRKRVRLRAELLLLLISCLMCFLALEIYVRLTWAGQWYLPAKYMRDDTVFSYMFKPNLDIPFTNADGVTSRIITNERGFRGPTMAQIADKPFRIVSIGDSFAQGSGINANEHAMTRFAENYAKAHPERGVALANVNCGGWSPDDYLFAYLTEVLPTGCELVVLSIFPRNDILPQGYRRTTTPSRDGPEFLTPSIWSNLKPKFFQWAKARIYGSALFNRVAIQMGIALTAFDRFNPDMEYQRKEWDTTFFYLDAIVKAVREHGSEIVILSYPTSMQVNTGRAIDEASFDSHMPEKMLAEFCRTHSVPFISPLDTLVAKNAKQDLYFPTDHHLSAKGHDVLLGVLEEQLTPIVDAQSEKRSKPPAAAPAAK